MDCSLSLIGPRFIRAGITQQNLYSTGLKRHCIESTEFSRKYQEILKRSKHTMLQIQTAAPLTWRTTSFQLSTSTLTAPTNKLKNQQSQMIHSLLFLNPSHSHTSMFSCSEVSEAPPSPLSADYRFIMASTHGVWNTVGQLASPGSCVVENCNSSDAIGRK